MYRHFLTSSIVACCLLFSPQSQSAEPNLPHWLRLDQPHSNGYQLARDFSLNELAVSAKLKCAVDFASAAIALNDQEILTVEPYCQLQTIDVTRWLKSSENRLTIDILPVDGPSAIAMELTIQLQSGQSMVLLSDEQWIATEKNNLPVDVCALEQVPAELWGHGRRDIALSPVENYEQWRQALTEASQATSPTFWIADGFEISLLRTATPSEGSWVSLTFDPQGRAIVSREDTGLLRLTLSADRKSIDRVEAINVDLKECRGLAFFGNELYANANNSKGLYKLKIDEAGQPLDLQLVRDFAGGVGHGRNDITICNEWLYTIHGDSVVLPHENTLDLTSPARHWSGDDSQHEGHLLRMHLPTQKWETVCGGLRNPYGISVHSSGDAFTFDADNEFDMGTPWYRPTRLVALYPGGDIGYRTASGKLPPRFHDKPENVPPVTTIGRSSPTAVYYDEQLAFPTPYSKAMYLLDWTYGRVIAVHLAIHGAGWRAQPELFLQGRPLNVTDVARGPDGAMYFVTGGRKTQSSVYRVSAVAKSTPANETTAGLSTDRPTLASAHESDVATFSRLQRDKRSSLESISRNSDASDLEKIGKHLADADPVVRHAARIALERLPKVLWRTTDLSNENQLTNLYAQLAFAQSVEASEAPDLLTSWLAWEPSKFNLSQRFAWLRIGELIARDNVKLMRHRAIEVRRRLLSAWPLLSNQHVAPEGDSIAWRQNCAQLLSAINTSEAPEHVTLDLLSSSLQEDQIAGLLALRHYKQGWTFNDRQQQFELLREPSTMIGGQGLPTFLNSIRTESISTLSAEEKELLKETLLPRTSDTPESNTPPRPLVRNWQVSDFEELTPRSTGSQNLARGALVFKDALCARCHRIGKSGSSVGPDLTFVGRRFSANDLLNAIITPSRSVAENYRVDVIVTQDGTVHTGRILVEGDYRSEKIRLQTDPLRADSVIEIDKKEIEDHRQLERSPMPDGLLDHFTREEIQDLISYLQNPQAMIP